MMKRSGFASGAVATLFLSAGAAFGAPSYCPTSSTAACGGREVGDILLANQRNGRILGLNPNTGAVYHFTTELPQNELGDIAVVPGDPLHVVAIGNVDSGIGIRRLDSCGHLGTLYGPYPQTFSPPIPPYDKGGMVGRGVVFNPLSGKVYAPDRSTRLLDDTGLTYNILFSFPQTGGPFSLELAYAPLAEALSPDSQGLLAADEMGSLYFGNGHRIAKIPTGGLQAGQPAVVEYSIGGDTLVTTTDIVHDGNHHLFVSGSSGGQGVVWRLDTLTGVSTLFSTDKGPSFDGEPFHQLQGITLDAEGHLLVVEKYTGGSHNLVARISKDDGSLLQHWYIPIDFGPGDADGLKAMAVLGVNLPAVREACSSDCEQGFVTDCFGACVPAVHVGDGFCDEGPHQSLACFSRGFDDRDCNDCPADQLPDCNGHCAPFGWVGDGICDDGAWWFSGQQIRFDCEEFRFDEATCLGCGSGEMLDCNGRCSPAHWLGDGVCDGGGYWYFDHPVDYRCVEYDFDRNDCPVGG